MGQYVIVVYQPKPGQDAALRDCIRDHLGVLRARGLATDRPAQVMRAADGAYLEIFEWKSAQAIEQAHHDPEVQRLWGRFDQACTFARLADLKEATNMFPAFQPVDL